MSEHGAPYAPYLPDRIRERLVVVLPSGCWQWQGARDAAGYGHARHNGRSALVHRLVFGAFGRTIPDGYVLDHVCHDPATCPGGPTCPHRACANPWHLVPTTHAGNASRDRSAPRGTAWKGSTCRRGHDLTLPGAIKSRRTGERECRECDRARTRRYRAAT